MGTNAIALDNHVHTWRCKHATGDVNDMAGAALRRKIGIITMSDHSPLPSGVEDFSYPGTRMELDQLPGYVDAVQTAVPVYAEQGLSIRLGLEVDHISSFLPRTQEMLNEYEWDCITGSVHYVPMDGKLLFLWTFDQTSQEDFQDRYFACLNEAIESGVYHVIAHPELIWITGLGDAETGARRRLKAEKQFIEVLHTAARCNVAMECNGSGFSRAYYDAHQKKMVRASVTHFPFPKKEFFEEVSRMGVSVSIASDAHSPDQVGDSFARTRELLLGAGVRSSVSYRKRVREDHLL